MLYVYTLILAHYKLMPSIYSVVSWASVSIAAKVHIVFESIELVSICRRFMIWIINMNDALMITCTWFDCLKCLHVCTSGFLLADGDRYLSQHMEICVWKLASFQWWVELLSSDREIGCCCSTSCVIGICLNSAFSPLPMHMPLITGIIWMSCSVHDVYSWFYNICLCLVEPATL